MAIGFAISEVHLRENGGYVVVIKLNDQNIEGTFEVTSGPRHQRGGRTRTHHHKTIEMLRDQARAAVATFCRKLGESLKAGQPQH